MLWQDCIALFLSIAAEGGGPRAPAQDREYRKAGGPREYFILVCVLSTDVYVLFRCRICNSLFSLFD